MLTHGILTAASLYRVVGSRDGYRFVGIHARAYQMCSRSSAGSLDGIGLAAIEREGDRRSRRRIIVMYNGLRGCDGDRSSILGSNNLNAVVVALVAVIVGMVGILVLRHDNELCTQSILSFERVCLAIVHRYLVVRANIMVGSDVHTAFGYRVVRHLYLRFGVRLVIGLRGNDNVAVTVCEHNSITQHTVAVRRLRDDNMCISIIRREDNMKICLTRMV